MGSQRRADWLSVHCSWQMAAQPGQQRVAQIPGSQVTIERLAHTVTQHKSERVRILSDGQIVLAHIASGTGVGCAGVRETIGHRPAWDNTHLGFTLLRYLQGLGSVCHRVLLETCTCCQRSAYFCESRHLEPHGYQL